jgi:hypothetical protein
MDIPRNDLYTLFEDAFRAFARKDAASIRDNVAERNLCGRLAIQFELRLPQFGLDKYYADPEYNRKQNGLIKTILNGEFEVVQVTCDLLLHSRGEQSRDNLIAIEMAKPDKTADQIRSDRHRLMVLTKESFDDVWSFDGETHPEHVCGYLLGAFIMVDRAENSATVEFFEGGAPTGQVQIFRVGTA